MEILAKATNGLGVVLGEQYTLSVQHAQGVLSFSSEHRYYGESIATKNLTTDSLRCASSLYP